jgi:putative transposase
LFLIELHTRRIRLAGVTDHPNGLWVVQRARELSMSRSGETTAGTSAPRFLVRDRDSKFTRAFDDVFAADGIQTIKTPVQAPNANAFAERWVRTVRQECLDWMLIWGRRHLERARRVRAALQRGAAAPKPRASAAQGYRGPGWA